MSEQAEAAQVLEEAIQGYRPEDDPSLLAGSIVLSIEERLRRALGDILAWNRGPRALPRRLCENAEAALGMTLGRMCGTQGCERVAGFYWHDAGPFGAGTTWGCAEHVPDDDLGDVWPVEPVARAEQTGQPEARAEHQFDPGFTAIEWDDQWQRMYARATATDHACTRDQNGVCTRCCRCADPSCCEEA